nr:bifunctional hydroxymethylpyrimidine kinase/phosphomethylpyrimidine kinase [Brevibacterium marinum]
MSIAGTDPSGGAGIHADLKTFTARGVLGTTAITALVAQNTHGVSRVYPIDDDFVSDQLDSVLNDMPVDATKSGMLGSRSLVELVVERAAQGQLGFYAVDPVMVATSGHRLLEVDAVAAVRDHLLPVSDLITPNLPEAALLIGDDVPVAQNPQEMVDQARQLVDRGPRAVLLKGGHAIEGDVADVLVTADGTVTEFTHGRVATPNTHGTGCTLSAAITAEVAVLKRGRAVAEVSSDLLHEAVDNALDYLARALKSAADWQVSLDPKDAHGPVDHQVDIVRR